MVTQCKYIIALHCLLFFFVLVSFPSSLLFLFSCSFPSSCILLLYIHFPHTYLNNAQKPRSIYLLLRHLHQHLSLAPSFVLVVEVVSPLCPIQPLSCFSSSYFFPRHQRAVGSLTFTIDLQFLLLLCLVDTPSVLISTRAFLLFLLSAFLCFSVPSLHSASLLDSLTGAYLATLPPYLPSHYTHASTHINTLCSSVSRFFLFFLSCSAVFTVLFLLFLPAHTLITFHPIHPLAGVLKKKAESTEKRW